MNIDGPQRSAALGRLRDALADLAMSNRPTLVPDFVSAEAPHEESLRLIRSFTQIKDAALRALLCEMLETLLAEQRKTEH